MRLGHVAVHSYIPADKLAMYGHAVLIVALRRASLLVRPHSFDPSTAPKSHAAPHMPTFRRTDWLRITPKKMIFTMRHHFCILGAPWAPPSHQGHKISVFRAQWGRAFGADPHQISFFGSQEWGLRADPHKISFWAQRGRAFGADPSILADSRQKMKIQRNFF